MGEDAVVETPSPVIPIETGPKLEDSLPGGGSGESGKCGMVNAYPSRADGGGGHANLM